MKILLLNGPNLSRLDLRDSSIYGDMDFNGLKNFIEEVASSLKIEKTECVPPSLAIKNIAKYFNFVCSENTR